MRQLRFTQVVSRFRYAGVAFAVVLLVAVFGVLEPRFLHAENLSAILQNSGILIVLASGQMLVVVTRNIDLSVGSTVGLAAMGVGIAGRDHPGLPIAVLILVGLIVGGLCGLLNGLLVTIGEVPPIIATLGTLAVFRGLTFVWSDSRQIDPGTIPVGVTNLATSHATFFSWLLVSALIVAAVVWVVTGRTLVGRRLYAIGSDPEAAVARGLSVTRLTVSVFVVMGVLAGLGGVLYIARFATVNPADAGLGYELTVLTAVVVGGTSILGGSGSIPGTLLGCVLIGVLANGLTVVGVSSFWQSAAQGAIILAAVVTDSVVRRELDHQRSLRRRLEPVRVAS